MEPAPGISTINKIINNSPYDAYLIIPAVKREREVLGKGHEPLQEPENLSASRIRPTVPVYKMKEAYVLHRNSESEKPLVLFVKPGEHGFIVTRTGLHPFEVGNYSLFEITKSGDIGQNMRY